MSLTSSSDHSLSDPVPKKPKELSNVCPCGKRYRQFRELITHMKIHNAAPDGFPCSNCPRIMKTQATLKRHTKQVHPDASAAEEVEPAPRKHPRVESIPLPQTASVPMLRDGPEGPELTEKSRFDEYQSVRNHLASGTEFVGEVQDGLLCGVCQLKVERELYRSHLCAHIDATKLQFTYLNEVLERTASCVKDTTDLC